MHQYTKRAETKIINITCFDVFKFIYCLSLGTSTTQRTVRRMPRLAGPYSGETQSMR